MFGAMAGAGVLPLSRAECEEAIRRGGKGAEASLRGFAAGFDARDGRSGRALPGRAQGVADKPGRARAERLPPETHRILDEGVRADHRLPGRRLRDSLSRPPGADREPRPRGRLQAHERDRTLPRAVDVLRGRDPRRRSQDRAGRRFERVREEVQAKPGEPVHVIEFLKPGVEELAAVLPRRLSRVADRLGRSPGARRQAQRRHAREDDERLRLPAAALARRDAAAAAADLPLARRAGADRSLARRRSPPRRSAIPASRSRSRCADA